MYDIIFCIFGCDTIPKYKNEILKINETWGKVALQYNIKLLYFLGEEKTDLIGEQYIHLPNVSNDHFSASDKQNLGLKYIRDNYDTKFVYICGTDTYVNIKKLLIYLKNFNHNDNLYIGGHGYHKEFSKYIFYHHDGGAGIILSLGCLKKIYYMLEDMFNEWKLVCNINYRNDAIVGCDLALGYFVQLEHINSTIIKNDIAFFRCNYKGISPLNQEGRCCIKYTKPIEYQWGVSEGRCPIRLENIIACHNMSLLEFDEFTKILEDNNYFVDVGVTVLTGIFATLGKIFPPIGDAGVTDTT